MKQGKAKRRNPSQEIICEFRGISEDLFNERIASGWTFNQAVLYPKECGSEFIDHEGNIFPSQAEMCRYWNVDPIEFQKRLKACSDMETALTGSNNKKVPASSSTEAEEILDVIMPIVAELFYSVKGAKERLDEEIRNKRISRMENFKERVRSGSISERKVAKEAAEEFQTSTRYGRYYRRVFMDGSDELIGLMADEIINLKQADKIVALGSEKEKKAVDMLRKGKSFRAVMAELGTPPAKDHMGRVYDSEEAMCKHWHLPVSLYKSRRKDSWPLCYALTVGKDEEFNITDHHGHTFPSIARLCAFYDMDKAEFARRMDEGWTLKEALLNPSETKETA